MATLIDPAHQCGGADGIEAVVDRLAARVQRHRLSWPAIVGQRAQQWLAVADGMDVHVDVEVAADGRVEAVTLVRR